MRLSSRTGRAAVLAGLLSLIAFPAAFAVDPSPATSPATGEQAELQSLKARIAQLEAREDQNWLTTERASQIRAIVQEALADAKSHADAADAPLAGYHNGFYLQSADGSNRLVVGGYLQARYEYAYQNGTNGRSLPGRNIGSGSTRPDDPGNASGFDIRRARVSFSGNVLSRDITYKLEGDFYGGAGGTFTVSDAYLGYRLSDLIKFRAGSFKVPFAKAELTSDPTGTFAERANVLLPFDPVRSLGVSIYGDIINDELAYELSIDDGSKANTLRQDDTVGASSNLDNRLGFYGRIQFAGSGKLSDFTDESDFRLNNRSFIWMLGGAAGYESQNDSNNAFPSPQSSTSIAGLSNGDGPGFTNATLNGDLYRATLDWSAKWRGLSFLTAAYFQQVNANPGHASSTSPTSITTGPFGVTDAAFFQHAYYAQVGYFVLPRKLELVGRAEALFTEGYPNIGQYYSLGANYYFFGQNLKLQSDVTYSPEDPYTDAASLQLQNASNLTFRVQLQAKF